jgi:hypothetical protein
MTIQKRPTFNGDYFFAVGLAERQKEWDEQYTNMSKEDAIQALEMGLKLKHRFFMDKEFIYMKDGDYYDEDDNPMFDFWKYRRIKEWKRDWSIIDH